MIDVLHASVIALAITHLATLGLLAVDLRRGRPMSSFSAVALGSGTAVAGAAVASFYVAPWSAAAAGALSVGAFIGYLAVSGKHLRPAGVAAWSSFVLMTVAASLWGVHFIATMPVSTLTRSLAWVAVALVAVSAPSALVQVREAWEPLVRMRWRRAHDLDPCALESFPMVSIHVPCHAEPPG